MKETIKVVGLMCNKCELRLENALKEAGVNYAKADYKKGEVVVEADDVSIEKIKQTIVDTGFDLN